MHFGHDQWGGNRLGSVKGAVPSKCGKGIGSIRSSLRIPLRALRTAEFSAACAREFSPESSRDFAMEFPVSAIRARRMMTDKLKQTAPCIMNFLTMF